MSKEYFRFSTSILSRLGEELNPDRAQSILELVKNSYDADAKTCTIELISTVSKGGTIRITDDGLGMTVKEIRNGWLVLGKSAKEKDRITKLGRLPVGNKGLGRLAALRMGSEITIITRNAKSEYKIGLDWRDFEKAKVVEDVALSLEENKGCPLMKKTGTTITISRLKTPFVDKDIRSLARSLILLADPFDNPTAFKPILKAEEFEGYECLVKNRYFDDAEYHLVAKVGKDGKARALVKDYRGKTLFSADHLDLSKSNNYRCPPAEFELWVYILDRKTFSTRSSTKGEVAKWLGECGGVHLYYRGMRVYPYGDLGHDWLSMNLRRSQSPEERPSTNTSIGRISVRDEEGLLQQKTDRSGFIENGHFEELREFAQDALEWMAKRRLSVAEKQRRTRRQKEPIVAQKAKDALDHAIKKLPQAEQADAQKAIQDYDKARNREAKVLLNEIELYRTLSTVGTTSATFAHESKNILGTILESAKTVARRGPKLFKDNYDKSLKEPVDRIIRSAEALNAFSLSTLSLLVQDKRRRKKVSIHNAIDTIVELFMPFFNERGVKVDKKFYPSSPSILGSESAIDAIIINLITNSLRAFEEEGAHSTRCMQFRTSIEGETLYLCVADSGPGIVGIKKQDIWLPGQSTVPNGTGLGLTIVRDAVTDLGGEIEVNEKGELGGAEFLIQLPVLEI